MKENIVYIIQEVKISVGKIGKLECDFILRDRELNYSYIQVSYTIMLNKEIEDREYKSLEQIKDNYSKCIAATNYLLQKRNRIKYI